MTTVIVRDVPEEVRDLLVEAARRGGQSLQNYLLRVFEREARFARNIELTELQPVGGGPLSMDEIVEAVHEARGEAPGP
ncbi:hypothetical protein CDG81_04160 [Actinopolyspora erythraea]|uniref:Antitoxin n=1 Tax=Actinopolyspora erythraea TaxID=414996 RepID=A0A099D5D3_9ACTN|nr:hypothetical protein [Actinopolyspora erythraea]ASU77637.1 hypothetical protein CDG81_04160 [Actinopolyspora erythraea]KGI80525.1 hypothetical protein IL38_16780 [Actinopolyspora erythraea]